MRSPVKYPGGKSKLVGKLLPYIPRHDVYAEVFGGGASLLFAKHAVKLEIYNDLHSGLVALFRVLRDKEKFQEFYRLVCLTPYSREEYLACRDDGWELEANEIMKAYKYFISARQGYAARQMDKTGWMHETNSKRLDKSFFVREWLHAIDLLPDISNRLQFVQVEHLDYSDFFNKYDAPDIFFYVDPPYYGVSKAYVHDFTEDDHERLLLRIAQLNGNVMLSNFRNDLYTVLDEIGWNSVDIDVWSTSGMKSKRIETIWMNYSL